MATVPPKLKRASKAKPAKFGKSFAPADLSKGKASGEPEKQSINKPKTNHGKGKFF